MTFLTQSVEGRHGAYELADEPLDVPAGSSRLFEVLGRPDLLYKEFRKPGHGSEEIERIEKLIEIGEEVRTSRRSPPAATRIAWPNDLVTDGNAVVGVVLPYVGDRFYRPGMAPLPRYLSYLRRNEEGIDDTVRLVLMRQLAGIMGVLEHADLVHGDLTGQNLLCAPPPEELIVLVDTDGIHEASKPRSNGETPEWKDPRLEAGLIDVHDMKSDWYALALAIGRTAARTKYFPTHEGGRLVLPSKMPAQVRRLLERTFADVTDADARPSPGEWAEALDLSLRRKRAPTKGSTERARGATFEYARPVATKPPRASWETQRGGGRIRRALIAFVVLLLAVTGVLAQSFLDRGPSDQARAEGAVRHWTKARLHTHPIEVRCPEGSSLDPEVHYVCHAETGSGAVAKVFVRVGARGRVRRRVKVIAYRKRAVLDDIRKRYRHLHDRGGYGLDSISCPRTFSARPGTVFTCPSDFSDGVHNGITVHLQSRRGRYRWEEDGASIGGRASALH